MSYLYPTNPDAFSLTPTDAAAGPRLGFLGALESSFEDQTRYGNMFGRAIATMDEEAANRQRIEALGEKAPPVLEPGGAFAAWTGHYDNFANVYNAMDPRPADALFGERDARLKELQGKYPDAGILTYGQIFDTVRQKAEAARFRAQADTTFSGGIGRFLGGLAGFVDPRTNPLAVAALPLAAPAEVGGVAVGAGVRIASEGLLQAGVQAAQTPGIMANQRALGGNPSPDEAALAILMAGAGGVAFRGIGEAVGARWFAKPANDTTGTPEPPLPGAGRGPAGNAQTARLFGGVDAVIGKIEGIDPALSALENTRLGRVRVLGDIEHATNEMGSWSVLPHEIMPPTSIRLPGIDAVRPGEVVASAAGDTVDEIARRIDPQVFTIYDKLATRLQQVQAILTRIDTPEARAAMAAQETVDTAIASARAKVAAATTAKQTERAQAELDALTASRGPMTPTRPEAVLHQHTSSGIVGRRAELARLTSQIDELRPVVQRAYARAQGKWNVYEEQRAQIKAMMDQGNHVLGPPTILSTLHNAEQIAKSPEKSLVRTVAVPLQESVEKATKVTEDAVEQFKSVLPAMVANADKSNTIKIEGIETPLNLNDKISVPGLDGSGEREITVRQHMKEAQEQVDLADAVSRCGGIKK